MSALWTLLLAAPVWATEPVSAPVDASGSSATDPVMELHAAAQVGLQVDAGRSLGGIEEHLVLSFARLQATTSEASPIGLMLQVDGSPEGVARLEAPLTEGLTLRAGRYKTPIGLEWLLPVFEVPFSVRTELTELLPRRRMGASLLGTAGPVAIEAGVFDPNGTLELTEGALLAGSARVEPAEHLEILLSGGAWTHAAAPDRDAHAPPWARHLDLGLAYTGLGWLLHLEGALAASPGGLGTGGLATVGHRWHVGRIDLEPLLGWDGLVTPERTVQQAHVGLNLHQLDDMLVESIEWTAESDDRQVGQRVAVMVQARL